MSVFTYDELVAKSVAMGIPRDIAERAARRQVDSQMASHRPLEGLALVVVEQHPEPGLAGKQPPCTAGNQHRGGESAREDSVSREGAAVITTGKSPTRVSRPRDMRNEKTVEAAGDRMMAMFGFYPIRFSQARATQQTPGIPDRLYLNPVRRMCVWWEAKREGGKQSQHQEWFESIVWACGMEYVVGTDEKLAMWLRTHGLTQGDNMRPRTTSQSYSRTGLLSLAGFLFSVFVCVVALGILVQLVDRLHVFGEALP